MIVLADLFFSFGGIILLVFIIYFLYLKIKISQEKLKDLQHHNSSNNDLGK